MKRKLNLEEVELIKNNEWVILSTASKDNIPHCIIVMPSLVEDNRIVISNIQMEETIRNVKENEKCFIDVYIKEENDKQIKINGIGKIFEDGELYNNIKEYEEKNNLPPELKVNSVIEIQITDVIITEG